MTQRTGKRFNIKLDYNEVEIEAHTLDWMDFKSVFIIVQGWFNLEQKDVYKLNKQIKRSLSKHMDGNIFDMEKIIDVVDAPRTLTNGFGHSLFEYTIFLKRPNLIDSKEMNPYTKRIVEGIYNENFINPDFIVRKKKKEIV